MNQHFLLSTPHFLPPISLNLFSIENALHLQKRCPAHSWGSLFKTSENFLVKIFYILACYSILTPQFPDTQSVLPPFMLYCTFWFSVKAASEWNTYSQNARENLSVSLSHVKNSAKERKEINDTTIKTTFQSQKSLSVKAGRLSLYFPQLSPFFLFLCFVFVYFMVGCWGCFDGRQSVFLNWKSALSFTSSYVTLIYIYLTMKSIISKDAAVLIVQ